MRRHAKWLVLWSLWLSGALPPAPAPLRLPSGAALRGRVAPDGSHVMYFGIPYASVPRRFQAPAAPAPWRGVLDAVDEHARCPQRFGPRLVGAEDCLRLNVYVPLRVPPPTSPPAPLAVMVFIHGGGFFEGSGSRLLYGPDYLVDKGIVLVTFNYRLAALGFLCLGSEEVPGNAGMKDQVAALRWVRANIAAFGGDPDNVTIFGESAGAASVSYHIASPMSAGLFHKAILQSGSSLAPWAQLDAAEARAAAAALARSVGHDVDQDDVRKLHVILTDATVEELLAAPVPKKEGRVLLEHLPYAPCIENRINGIEAFVTEYTHDILLRGSHSKVPVIIGSNSEEGYFFAALEDDETMFASDFEQKLPKGLTFPTERERWQAAGALRRLYLGAAPLAGAGAALRLARFYGDAYFSHPARAEAALLQRAGARVFAYSLTRAGWRGLARAGLAALRAALLARGRRHARGRPVLFVPRVPAARMARSCAAPHHDHLLDELRQVRVRYFCFLCADDPRGESVGAELC